MSSASAVLTKQRDLLAKFVGTEPLSLQDRFWHELLTFSQPLPKLRPADVEEFIHPLCAQIVVNNDATHNFGKLLVHLVESLKSTPPAITDLPIKAVNTVYITRVFLKYFTEHSTGSQIIGLLCDPPTDESPKPKTTARSAVLKATIQALFEFIGTNKPSKSTYLLHLEVLNLLLVMTSTQLTSAPGTSGHETHPFLAAMMAETELAPMVLQALLTHYIERTPAPPNIPLYAADTPGMVSKVGSTAVSVLMMPFTLPYRGLFGAANAEAPAVESTAVLMDISVLLVLVLVHHDPGTQDPNNPFRTALNTCRDTDYDVVSPAKGQDTKEIIRVPFSALYDTLGACLVDDRSTLLLYSLIHGNSGFLDYVLVRTDLDTLLLPLLQMLYNASNRTANQIYMLLIILLILSQDSSFNANIHKLILPGVPW
ncbi:hypothetical protein CYMTET_27043 [Cymbomonas tetramitiformis]|uniref:Dymeclin n=1 Tax=Cymbomonas tetramitiformis TaxID=36881 RepID=A0AAE0FQJ1_9CHLO|nr:hypothetical protein CYMTET_27043 [Cymbomonas tetramitiformis]